MTLNLKTMSILFTISNIIFFVGFIAGYSTADMLGLGEDCTQESISYRNENFTDIDTISAKECNIIVYQNAVVGAYTSEAQFGYESIYNVWEIDIDNDSIYITGTLGAHMPFIFQEIQKQTNIKKLILLDITGSVDDTAINPVLREIYTKKYTTHLTSESEVYSGGTDFFASGYKRTMETGAIVGIHSWTDNDGTNPIDLPKDSPEHQLYISLYNHTGVPEEFYWLTINSATAENMHNMTDDEIKKYLLTQ